MMMMMALQSANATRSSRSQDERGQVHSAYDGESTPDRRGAATYINVIAALFAYPRPRTFVHNLRWERLGPG